VSAPRLVLLDRDGVLNRKAPEGEYVRSPAELQLLPGAAAAVARLNRAGVLVAVVTNQRGVALGRMSEDDLAAVHAALRAGLGAEGAHLDAIYACPHHAGTCDCRKPRPGLLRRALAEHAVAPAQAVMVGDAPSDVEAGRRAGVATIRVGGAAGEAADLAEAVQRLLGA
jgi:D-glycero-D-manno-heptose 1,7-bisphosphate phosphatase